VRLGDFTLEAQEGRLDATGAVKVAIRPERVHLYPHDSTGANRIPGMVERLVFLGSTTHIFLRVATGAALQGLIRNDGAALPYSQGTPVSIGLPADALRVLPDPGVSVAEIHDEALGDQLLDLTSPAPGSS
jgi:spermidine/putrescine transport system ATP-binding protein